MRYYMLNSLRLSHKCATFWLNSVKIRKKYLKTFGTFAEMRYICTRNQVSWISRGTMARLELHV